MFNSLKPTQKSNVAKEGDANAADGDAASLEGGEAAAAVGSVQETNAGAGTETVETSTGRSA